VDEATQVTRRVVGTICLVVVVVALLVAGVSLLVNVIGELASR
jgi:hypothetical protein